MFFIRSGERTPSWTRREHVYRFHVQRGTEGIAHLQNGREVSLHNENTHSSFNCVEIKSGSGEKKTRKQTAWWVGIRLITTLSDSVSWNPSPKNLCGQKQKILQKETELMRNSKCLKDPEFKKLMKRLQLQPQLHSRSHVQYTSPRQVSSMTHLHLTRVTCVDLKCLTPECRVNITNQCPAGCSRPGVISHVFLCRV